MGYANKYWQVNQQTMTGFQREDDPGQLERMLEATLDPLEILIREEEEHETEYLEPVR